MDIIGGGRAVVLGAGIAGLLAARVLAEHFAEVDIVERDTLAAGPRHRRGVPQGRHLHGLLPRGLQLFEELLPGFLDEMLERGAISGDVLHNIRWYVRGRALRQRNAGLPVLCAGRPLIEAVIRERVLSRRNIVVHSGAEVVALHLGPDGRRVIGADVADRATGTRRTLPADLTVDATGRGSRVHRWLAEGGYAPPPVERIDIDLWYATGTFASAPEAFGTDIMVSIARLPKQRRSGIMQRIEGDRVLVTLAGIRGDRPPLDPHGFAEFAGSLAAPDIHQLIADSPARNTPVQFHCPSYERRRYERLADYPAGLLPIGDAMCSFNPAYAEGMTVAARSAAVLDEQLRTVGDVDSAAYFRAVCAILDAPWTSGIGADLGTAGMSPPEPPEARMTREYLADLEYAASQDAALAVAYVRVAGLIDPPGALLSGTVRNRVAAVRAASP